MIPYPAGSADRADRPFIAGEVSDDFAPVRLQFERNFLTRGERGAACTIYHRGQKVVDLWGGQRCVDGQLPWEDQTLCLAFSVTKGMAAAAMAVAHSRGLFELDEPVATYWPEFAAGNKHRVTVRQLLTHQAGLISVGRKLNAEILANHDWLAEVIAPQKPFWEPGTRHGYHTLTLGWYQSELIRRVDPQRRSLGAFFADEIAAPLGIEFYIGLPPHVPLQRVSRTKGYHRVSVLANLDQLPPKMVIAGIWPRSLVARSVRVMRINNPAEVGGPEFRHVEIPSANGIGQARALAKVYDVLARGGRELGVTESTWRELIAPPAVPQLGSHDAILKTDTRYSFGFSRPSGGFPFGSDHRAFGCPGAGGAFAMADPGEQLGLAYLTNTMSFRIFDDPRERAIRQACYACVEAMRRRQRAA